ncbi:MAG: preprotein translocase subunit SecA [Gammaproteobacteria bacterium]|nr:preprotein translocase subunit SecA [Gammaproteobacteria bacterium]
MLLSALTKIFGSKNTRELKRFKKIVNQINEIEESLENLSDDQLRDQRNKLKDRLDKGEILDAILPEAFATVREAGKRALGMRVFDVQIMGGIALHEGRIAEMRTGEGKTLVATLPLYLNCLQGSGVHLVTVNDYLAKWGAQWMGPLYDALGVTVGVVYSGQTLEEKKFAYNSDITYGTNNEFGFDYLRDNMSFSEHERTQRGFRYAIVDEVDSILIDEARTPLIISGSVENAANIYKTIDSIIPSMEQQIKTPEDITNEIEPPGDYYVDEKQKDVEITEEGHQKIERALIEKGLLQEGNSLYGAGNLSLLQNVSAALKAHTLFQRDVDYIVSEKEVVIVDEHTGRTMPGRRWGNGLHQAIEAKERVKITNESQTLASTTFQNYFRLYTKLAGMTGTADTEAAEFKQIYGLDVVVIPTNLPMIREDNNDLIFMTQDEKYEALADEVEACLLKSAPILVGTASIESSERVSDYLKKKKIQHKILNAKFHEKEAEIIAQAGKPGSVTIATNMAGRGTDIILGGNWEAEVAQLKNPSEEQVRKIKEKWVEDNRTVLDAGGLHVVGTERHESRRIDNQLRGRSGRQGDPGYSRFYLSLEDSLMRIFASDRMRGFMQNLGMEKGEAIEHRMVNNAIEKAQRKVEGRNFDIRKQLLEYDDVANDQRQMIYSQRNELIESDDISDIIDELWTEVIEEFIDGFVYPDSLEEQWDVTGLEKSLLTEFGAKLPIREWLKNEEDLDEKGIRDRIVNQVRENYRIKDRKFGPGLRVLEKRIMLDLLDNLWKEHLAAMDYLRQGIHLRAYAQKQPKSEYKRESFQLFENLLRNIRYELIKFLSLVDLNLEDGSEALDKRRKERRERTDIKLHGPSSGSPDSGTPEESKTPFVRTNRRVGRNESCPCGSGEKFKRCHGKLDS